MRSDIPTFTLFFVLLSHGGHGTILGINLETSWAPFWKGLETSWSFLELFWHLLRKVFRQCIFISIGAEFCWILRPSGEAKMIISLARGRKNQTFEVTAIKCYTNRFRMHFGSIWVFILDACSFGKSIKNEDRYQLGLKQARWQGFGEENGRRMPWLGGMRKAVLSAFGTPFARHLLASWGV